MVIAFSSEQIFWFLPIWPKSPYRRGPIRSTRYKMERPRRGCVNLPYLAGTKKRPVKKGPYKLISPSKYKHSWEGSPKSITNFPSSIVAGNLSDPIKFQVFRKYSNLSFETDQWLKWPGKTRFVSKHHLASFFLLSFWRCDWLVATRRLLDVSEYSESRSPRRPIALVTPSC